jgi:hypothetical protein
MGDGAKRILDLSILAGVLVLASGSAVMAACDGQRGATIFEDKFQDGYGGWDLTPPIAKISPPVLSLNLGDGQHTYIHTQVLTFNADSGDYCVDFTLPNAPQGNRLAFGLAFWATDYSNLMLWQVDTNKTAALFKRADGNWNLISSATVDAIKTGAGAVNTLRVLADGDRLTLLVNDINVRVIRAQVPKGRLRFGLYAQLDAAAKIDQGVEIRHFRVTERSAAQP